MTRRSSAPGISLHLADLFLPNGYPDSVREGYAAYQMWSLFQTFVCYLRGALGMKELLRGMGVGDAEATAAAGAVGWIVRDGAGMAGSLLFSWCAAKDFDRNVRQWRIFADVVNTIGLTLNMLAPSLGRSGFLLATVGGSVFTSMCGVAGGATNATVTQWFARKGNVADCVAKEGAQRTAVNIIGLIGSLVLCNVFQSRGTVWIVFAVLTVLHSIANARATATLCFSSISDHRFNVLFERFWNGPPGMMTVRAVAEAEPWLPSIRQSKIAIGHKLNSAMDIDCEDFCRAVNVARSSKVKYTMVSDRKRSGAVIVLLNPQCSPLDVLEARFYAQAKHTAHMRVVDRASWVAFLAALRSAGWDTERTALSVAEWRYDWDSESAKDQ
jgi:hypothetical protein